MTVREYLRRPDKLRREILRRKARAAALRDLAASFSLALEQVSVRSTPDVTRMQELLADAADEDAEIRRLTGEMNQVLAETVLYVSSLPDEQLIRVMRLRYLEGLEWPDIALRMGYCASRTFELHSRALRLLPPPPENPP